MRKPILEIVDWSEIEADVDTAGISLDLVFRPVHINQEGDFLQLTIADARRLLEFLNEALPYLEGKFTELM